jgi:hypothetical protein
MYFASISAGDGGQSLRNNFMLNDSSADMRELGVQRLLIFCAGAILFGMMAWIAATYGLSTIARCETETNGALGQSGNATSQIALSSACGF